jgi:hypothetical protein
MFLQCVRILYAAAFVPFMLMSTYITLSIQLGHVRATEVDLSGEYTRSFRVGSIATSLSDDHSTPLLACERPFQLLGFFDTTFQK